MLRNPAFISPARRTLVGLTSLALIDTFAATATLIGGGDGPPAVLLSQTDSGSQISLVTPSADETASAAILASLSIVIAREVDAFNQNLRQNPLTIDVAPTPVVAAGEAKNDTLGGPLSRR